MKKLSILLFFLSLFFFFTFKPSYATYSSDCTQVTIPHVVGCGAPSMRVQCDLQNADECVTTGPAVSGGVLAGCCNYPAPTPTPTPVSFSCVVTGCSGCQSCNTGTGICYNNNNNCPVGWTCDFPATCYPPVSGSTPTPIPTSAASTPTPIPDPCPGQHNYCNGGASAFYCCAPNNLCTPYNPPDINFTCSIAPTPTPTPTLAPCPVACATASAPSGGGAGSACSPPAGGVWYNESGYDAWCEANSPGNNYCWVCNPGSATATPVPPTATPVPGTNSFTLTGNGSINPTISSGGTVNMIWTHAAGSASRTNCEATSTVASGDWNSTNPSSFSLSNNGTGHGIWNITSSRTLYMTCDYASGSPPRLSKNVTVNIAGAPTPTTPPGATPTPGGGGGCGFGAYCDGNAFVMVLPDCTVDAEVCTGSCTPLGCSSGYSIHGTVWIDRNMNGGWDFQDSVYQGARVNGKTTDSGGQYVIAPLPSGSYGASVDPSSIPGYIALPPISRFTYLDSYNPSAEFNFGIQLQPTPTPTPITCTTTFSGNVVVDPTSNDCSSLASLGGTAYSGAGQVSAFTTDATGLPPEVKRPVSAGSYSNLTYAPTCGGTSYLTLMGVSPYTVTGVCDRGVYENQLGYSYLYTNTSSPTENRNVTFLVTNQSSWFQVETGDVRFPWLYNKIPAGNKASLSDSSLFTSSNDYVDLGNGTFDLTKNWQIDREYSYNNDFQNGLGGMSYTFYLGRAKQRAITINPIGFSTIDLSSKSTGVYQTDGDLTITASSGITGGKHIVLLVGGNASINTNILVPPGQGNLFVLSAKGDIRINQAVGTSTLTSTVSNLDGYYAAEGSIVLSGINDCLSGNDLRLNVGGALIANSLHPYQTDSFGGKITINRNICNGNVNPTYYVAPRNDFLFQMTDFYKIPYKTFREVNP